MIAPGSPRRRFSAWLLFLSLSALAVLACFVDPRTRLLAENTLLLVVACCGLSVPLGTVLAVLLVRSDLPWRRLLVLGLACLLFLPLYLQAAAWDAGFGRMGWLTLASEVLDRPWLIGWRATVWIHSVAAIPWVVLIVGIGLRYVEPELEEEALLCGTPFQVLANVTLRRATPAIGVAALWVAVWTAGEMTVTDIYGIRTYAEELYTGFALADEVWRVWLSMLPGILVVVWLTTALLLAVSSSPRGLLVTRTPFVFELRAWKWPAAAIVAALLLLSLGVPLGNLCYKAGQLVESVAGRHVRYWSAAKFVEVFWDSPREFSDAIGWTLLTGALAASATVLLAAPLAWAARRGGVGALPAFMTSGTCLAVPGPLVGLATLGCANWISSGSPAIAWLEDRTVLLPVIAMTVRSLPLAILILWFALASLPDELLDAAATEGAGPLRRFWAIALPERRAALAGAWLVALAVATGDLGATNPVLPPGMSTVAFQLFSLVHAGVRHKEAGLGLVSAAGYLAIAALAIGLLRPLTRVLSGKPR